jgi:Zn finger protein HypA/HybF involved in hydrogenase expression
MEKETRMCDSCKKEFIPKRQHQRFCNKCKDKNEPHKKMKFS